MLTNLYLDNAVIRDQLLCRSGSQPPLTPHPHSPTPLQRGTSVCRSLRFLFVFCVCLMLLCNSGFENTFPSSNLAALLASRGCCLGFCPGVTKQRGFFGVNPRWPWLTCLQSGGFFFHFALLRFLPNRLFLLFFLSLSLLLLCKPARKVVLGYGSGCRLPGSLSGKTSGLLWKTGKMEKGRNIQAPLLLFYIRLKRQRPAAWNQEDAGAPHLS